MNIKFKLDYNQYKQNDVIEVDENQGELFVDLLKVADYTDEAVPKKEPKKAAKKEKK